MNRIELEEREQEALNSLEEAKERIRQLQEDFEHSRVTNERLIQKLETEVKSVAVLEDDLSFWKKECASAIDHMEQLEEDVRFWKGEYEAGVGRVQIVERDLANAQRDLADMTKLAVDYKEANARLEDELREFHAKDGGRTREHNLLVQENRKLREALNAVAHHLGLTEDGGFMDSGLLCFELQKIAREALTKFTAP